MDPGTAASWHRADEDRFWTKFCEIVGVRRLPTRRRLKRGSRKNSCVLAGRSSRPRRLLFDRRLVEEALRGPQGGRARDLLQTVEADGVGFRRCRFRSWRLDRIGCGASVSRDGGTGMKRGSRSLFLNYRFERCKGVRMGGTRMGKLRNALLGAFAALATASSAVAAISDDVVKSACSTTCRARTPTAGEGDVCRCPYGGRGFRRQGGSASRSRW